MIGPGTRLAVTRRAVGLLMMILLFPLAAAAAIHIVLTEDYLQGGEVVRVTPGVQSTAPIPVEIPWPSNLGSLPAEMRWHRFTIRPVSYRLSTLAPTTIAGVRGFFSAAGRAEEIRLEGDDPMIKALVIFMEILSRDTESAPLPHDELRKFLNRMPDVQSRDHAEYHFVQSLKAALLDAMGDAAGAAALLRLAAEEPEADTEIWFRVARLELQDQNLVGAVEALNRYLGAAPENSDAWSLLALIKLKEGALAEAAIAVRRALAADAASIPAHVLSGLIHEQDGKFADAEIAYARALELARSTPGVPPAAVASYEASLRRIKVQAELAGS